MNGFLPAATGFSSFLLTYLVHSTVIIIVTALLSRRMKNGRYSELRVLIWKASLILPIMTNVRDHSFSATSCRCATCAGWL